jgi:cytochrome P450
VGDFANATLVDDSLRMDPQDFYAFLRAEQPVYKDTVSGAFIVSRYDDLRHILMNPKIFSSDSGATFTKYKTSAVRAKIEAMYTADGYLPLDTLITIDPPEHGKYRKLVQEAFSISRVALLRETVSDYCNDYIDGFIDEGRCDFVAAMALPLPVKVISDQLEVLSEDYGDFRHWSDGIVDLVHPMLTPEKEIELVGRFVEMQKYFINRVEFVRQHPSDTIMGDLVRVMDANPDELSMQELMSMVAILVVAGNETTGNGLSAAIWHLTQNPDIAEELSSNLEDEKRIEKFVEEALRLDTPAAITFRVALQDTSVAGVPIPKGAMIFLPLLAGNLDPEMFGSPSQIDINRNNGARHLSFGQGIHICVGMHLARLELKVGVKEMLRRVRNIRLDPDHPPERNHGFPVRGYTKLPILFDKIG